MENSPIDLIKNGFNRERIAHILRCNEVDVPSNLQELFLLVFKNGGHQVHVSHGTTLGNVIDLYVKVLESKKTASGYL